ncbi:MAG TPA: peptidoglycan binding domain-containing protein [Candidatus Pelethocola excrementipullorum]|nr:peptidoglycan binding domain-containing protein [Candidatus Pelethocola excrementipullorum]
MKTLTKSKKILLGVLLGIVLIMIGVYLGVSFFFQSHFLSGTTINGIDCSRMTVEQVKEAIQDRVMEYNLTLKERGENTETITAEQLALTYVDDQGVEKLMEDQNGFMWLFSLASDKNFEMAANTTYDKEIIDGLLDNLDAFQGENIKPPTDATIQETDTGYTIQAEDQGNTLKREEVKAAVIDAIDTGKTELDLEGLELYEKPAILSSDEGLIAEVEHLNTLTSANIVYDFVDRQYTVDRSVIKGWMVKGEDGKYTMDEAKVAEWVKQMAVETDTFGLAREFKTTSGKTITLPYGGDYGWYMNKDQTTQALIEGVNAGTQEVREPVYVYSGMDRSKNDIGGTYVEISITAQKMWCYKDGKLVVETPVITGNHSTGYDTPSGHVWAIDAKKRDAHFKRYNSDVTFWLPFNGDVGIHDASWRAPADYVPSLYTTNGSHGCINTPYDAAEKIFNTVGIGHPVIVYYSTDQVVGPAPTQQNSI